MNIKTHLTSIVMSQCIICGEEFVNKRHMKSIVTCSKRCYKIRFNNNRKIYLRELKEVGKELGICHLAKCGEPLNPRSSIYCNKHYLKSKEKKNESRRNNKKII